MELDYAPAARVRSNTQIWVIVCGLLTSGLTLLGLHFIQEHVDVDIMSFTVKVILPVGAIGIGLLAGLGYFLGSLLLGTRVRGWLLWSIVALQIVSYFSAQYIEFAANGPMVHRDTGARIGFLEYYHVMTVTMTHMPDKSTSPSPYKRQQEPEQLGNTGYFYRGLGIIGFVLGGIILPAALRARPYCDLCQRYMKNKSLVRMAASAPLAKFRVKSKFSLDTPEHRAALENAANVLKELQTSIVAGDESTYARLIAGNKKKIKGKVPLFATLQLQHCRQCRQGVIIGRFENGDNMQSSLAGELFREHIAAETVVRLVEPKKLQTVSA